ncbi:MAG: sterol desaturase family protein [Hyphomicrobiaceae bacterium]|nr:sterol desaturase family protein [Hyphomicrobiaceae bacterium]
MALAEAARPKRQLNHGRAGRWFTNLAIVTLDSVVVRAMAAVTVPLVAVAAALYAQHAGIGILNALELPAWLAWGVSLVALDLAIWFQHLVSHKVPLFWRLHRVHHADVDIDVSTALRFHPIEIAVSMLWKVVVVLALGAPPEAVLLFEIILNGCAMFNHANVSLPAGVDRVLRKVIVTPDMHRVHHSVHRSEHDTNFGFNLSIWDRIFGTYTAQPRDGHLGMTIGLEAYQSEEPTRLAWSLSLPFGKNVRGG